MNAPRAAGHGISTPSPNVSPAGARLDAAFRKRYASSGEDFALDVAFQSAPGFTILFGASGAGKTTLLDCVAGLVVPDSGRIAIGQRVLFDSAHRINVPVPKRRVGYVFQDLALFPHMSVEQNVLYGLNGSSPSEQVQRTDSVLQAFHIAHLSNRSAREISGGESQRVALARTLVTEPDLLLLDEPLAALDAPTKAHIMDDLRAWSRAHRIPILYVTHSREEVFALGERVLVLARGRIVAQGTPHEVMTAPLQETVALLAGFENIFDAVVEAVHPERGTMACRVPGGKGTASAVPSADEKPRASAPEGLHCSRPPNPEPAEITSDVLLETPLVQATVGSPLRVGIRAGDILLATSQPQGLSARNVIPGRIGSIEQRDVMVSVRVNCGVEMEVHLTLAARDSLLLAAGKEVWLVIKTYSCHLMQC